MDNVIEAVDRPSTNSHAVRSVYSKGLWAAQAARYWRWNEAVARNFDEAVVGPAIAFAAATGADGRDDWVQVHEEFVALGCEAIGRGYIDQASLDPATTPRSLLAICWTRLLPRWLPGLGVVRARALMVRLWNAGEALIHEAPWLNRWLAGRASSVDSVEGLLAMLDETRRRFAVDPGPSTWAGPLTTTVLDLGTLGRDFIPGNVHEAHPRLVCVHHRVKPGVQASILVERTEAPVVVGFGPCPGRASPTDGVPAIDFGAGALTVGPHLIALPTVAHCYSHTATSSGFVVAVAVDSQLLWIVECQ